MNRYDAQGEMYNKEKGAALGGQWYPANETDKKIKELEEKLKIAKEALGFYADENNWYITTADKGVPVPHCPTSNDWGDKAREALEKIKD